MRVYIIDITRGGCLVLLGREGAGRGQGEPRQEDGRERDGRGPVLGKGESVRFHN